MRNLTRAVMIAGVVSLGGGVGAGCGGDDDGGSSGDVSTGIAPSKLLSDVTATEAASACERIASAFETKLSEDRLVRSFCTLFGAASATTKAECETLRDDCIDEADQGQGVGVSAASEFEGVAPDCTGDADLSQCEGTVGELETCVNDTLDQVLELLDSFSCDDAGSVDPGELGDMNEDLLSAPTSCQAVDCGDGGPFSGE